MTDIIIIIILNKNKQILLLILMSITGYVFTYESLYGLNKKIFITKQAMNPFANKNNNT
jgi:hypothetical protein